MSVYNCLTSQDRPIHLRTSEAEWNSFLGRVHRLEADPASVEDEGVWTFLVAYGFAIAGEGDALARVLCKAELTSSGGDIWLESAPLPPRQNERNTKVDLAAGHVRPRGETISGIEFDPLPSWEKPWALLVECKWRSDMSVDTTYDPLRGQMLRVIENALVLQAESKFPEAVHFTLLTPEIFQRHPRLRGYGLLFHEYSLNPSLIVDDLKVHQHPVRSGPKGWAYPGLDARIGCLHLHWVSFEKVFEKMPATAFKAELLTLARRQGTLLNLPASVP